MPGSARKALVDTLADVAARHGLEFVRLSHDWVLQLIDTASGRRCSVFGYTFDTNPAAAVEICREKAATSLVLEKHGLPHIPHSVILDPGNPSTADFVPRRGNWTDIQKLVNEFGLPVVLKPLKGTGGVDVIKANCWREVEAAVQHLFSKEYGLAISPYKKVLDEYRCFFLDGKVEFVYRKVRAEVIGDGSSTFLQLATKNLAHKGAKEAKLIMESLSSINVDELDEVPSEGQKVPVQWKHNLGQGASVDVKVPEDMVTALSKVAVDAATAIGMHFCSVDIVTVKDEGMLVMEVNSGVMMDSLVTQLGEEGSALALRLYEQAVLKGLGK